MMSSMDVTPLVSPTVNWAVYAPYETKSPSDEEFSRHTRLAVGNGEPFELFVSKTGIQAPTAILQQKYDKFSTRTLSSYAPAKRPIQKVKGAVAVADADIDHIAKQRISLLAVKYASDSTSAEIVARLEILNQRILDQSPRISKVQVEALEIANDTLNRIRLAREERAGRLGIAS